MYRVVSLVLVLLLFMVLNNKKDIYEGYEDAVEGSEEDVVENSENVEGKDSKEGCEYRKKQNTGNMCKEKWGEPNCYQWKKIGKLKRIEGGKGERKALRGYHSNPFMYEIDYKEYEIPKVEGEEDIDTTEDIPLPVHSSFFT